MSVSLLFQAVVVDEDGSQVITFPNGTRKVINTDGSVSMYFFNGDSKQIKPDNTVVNIMIYFYLISYFYKIQGIYKYIFNRFTIMLNQIQLTLHFLMDWKCFILQSIYLTYLSNI